MSSRLHFTPRGCPRKANQNARDCILMAPDPMPVALGSVCGNRAVVTSGAPIAIGTRIALLHPEAGMISGNVVDTIGNRLGIAFNAGDRALGFALKALSRAAN